LVPAVKANSPLPPVEVRSGYERVPSSAICREIMLDPAGLLSRKYAAREKALELIAAAETRTGARRRVRACILR
jgi:hypothetical protein